MKYKIPIIGWIIAVIEYLRADRTLANRENFAKETEAFDAACVAYDNTETSLIWTMRFIILCIIVVLTIKFI